MYGDEKTSDAERQYDDMPLQDDELWNDTAQGNEERQTYGEEQEAFGVYLSGRRNEWGYTLKQLAEGLCSASELSRIENGERTPDKVFRDRLLARMGISPDLHEYFLFYDEYDPWKLRQQVLNAMIERDLVQAEALLSAYREKYGREGTTGVYSRLEQQFCLNMEVQLARLNGAAEEKLAELFQKALQLTAPQIDQGIRGQALSVHEMDLLLETLRYEKPAGAKEHYRELLIYIEKSRLDPLSRARIYPKAIYYFLQYGGSSACDEEQDCEKEQEEALRLCEEGIELLRNTGRAYYLVELLDTRRVLLQESIEAFYNQGEKWKAKAREVEQEKNEGWLRTLEQTYEEYGISPRMENTCYLYVEKGVHCIGDVIRLRRNMLGLSRRQLCENLCSEKTLRRLERNEQRTQKEIVRELFGRLNLAAEYCRMELITDSAEAKERMRELRRAIRNWDCERADILIQRLKKLIPMGNPINRQMILRYQVANEQQKGTITNEAYCLGIIKALEYTLPLEAALSSGEKYMTDEEILCIQNIASESEETEEIRRKYIEILYEKYRFYEENRIVSSCINMYEVVMDYVASDLGNMGEYDRSDAISHILITESLRLRRLYGIHKSIYNILWNDAQQHKEGSLPKRKRNTEVDLQRCLVLSEFCNETRDKKFYWRKFLSYREE